MMQPTKILRTQSFEELQWTLDSKSGQPVPDSALNQSLLLDIREKLGSIRSMLIFFTVLVVIGLVLMFVQIIVR